MRMSKEMRLILTALLDRAEKEYLAGNKDQAFAILEPILMDSHVFIMGFAVVMALKRPDRTEPPTTEEEMIKSTIAKLKTEFGIKVKGS